MGNAIPRPLKERPTANDRDSGKRERNQPLLARAGIRIFLAGGIFLFPLVARAQQEAERFQQDPVEHVAARVLVALAIIGIGVVIYSL